MPLLQALIGLFELPEDDTIPDDEHFIEIEDTPGTVTSNEIQLQFCTILDSKIEYRKILNKPPP